MIGTKQFSNKYLNSFFNSQFVEGFFFSLICATIFTFTICHWMLDLNYKYSNPNQKGVIVDVNWVFWIVAVAALYYIIKKQSIQFDFALVMLLSGMILVAVFDYHAGNFVFVCYAWVLPIAYIIGKLVASCKSINAQKRIIQLIAVLVVASFIASLLDFGVNWSQGWAYGTERWNTFWTHDIIARTTYEYGFIMTTALMCVALLIIKKKPIISISIIALNILIQYIVIHVEGRENTCMLAIMIVLFLAMYIYDNWHKVSAKTKRIITMTIAIMLLLIAITVFAFYHNFFGIHDAYKNSRWSYWSGSGGLVTNVRFKMDYEAFFNMLKYPLEDFQAAYNLPRSHNMLLEYGRVYDLTIFGLLFIYKLCALIDIIKLALIRDKNVQIIKYILVAVYINCTLYYFLEPNAHAFRYFWMLGLLVNGMVRGWHERYSDALQKYETLNAEINMIKYKDMCDEKSFFEKE